MQLALHRELSNSDHTFGVLRVEDLVLQTIERPWIAAPDHPGGQNGISCVPPGLYQLVPHDTEAHPETWALVNPKLGVWHLPSDVYLGQQGRSCVLIHPANFAHELLGCIAPGMERGNSEGLAMVTQSRLAFARLKTAVPWPGDHTIDIVT